MEIAETITLTAAVLWIIWQLLSLITMTRKFSVVTLARIIWLPTFTIMAITVILFHLSALHLIWLWGLSFILGLLAVMSPWFQQIALEIFVILSLVNDSDELEELDDDEQDEFCSEEDLSRSKLVAMQPLFKGIKKDKPQGFG
jgi:hypothetical protein